MSIAAEGPEKSPLQASIDEYYAARTDLSMASEEIDAAYRHRLAAMERVAAARHSLGRLGVHEFNPPKEVREQFGLPLEGFIIMQPHIPEHLLPPDNPPRPSLYVVE